MTLNMVMMTIFGLWAVNLALPVLLVVVDFILLKFILRGEMKGLADRYQQYKYCTDDGLFPVTSSRRSWDIRDTLVSAVFLDGLAGGVLIVILAAGVETLFNAVGVIDPLWLLVPASPFIARFVVDICRTLRMRNGESQRLKEIEDKLAKYESK